MSINIGNYELFVMDYLEGTLDEMEAQEMSTFLLLHPDIAIEIDGLADAILISEPELKLETSFIDELKKNEFVKVENINEQNYEQFFIAQLENDIKPSDAISLKVFLKENPSLVSEFNRQQSTKFTADEKIIFKQKGSLKQKDKSVIVLWPIIASIAALLLLSFWLFKPMEMRSEFYSLKKLESKKMSSLNIEQQEVFLTECELLIPNALYIEPLDNAENIIRYANLPNKMNRHEKQISLPNKQWEKEMILMQSLVFDRNRLYSQVDYASLPEEKKSSAFRLVSSLLWKTTKGQIKNMSEEIIQDNYRIWQAGKLQALADDYISVKPRSVE